MMEKIPEIVLTGGPCSGKTTALSYISEKMGDKGFRTLMIPEVATTMITSGISDILEIAKTNPLRYIEIERQMLRMQLDIRRRYDEIARIFDDEKVIKVFDRGLMDVKAYLEGEFFWRLLEAENISLHEARDSFEGVIHMMTAAEGAEEFYSLENNPARLEDSLDLARKLDAKTRLAWVGHPHLKVIDNSTDFKGKLKRVEAALCRMIGIPVPIEIERKFLVEEFPDLDAAVSGEFQKISIEQMYLVSNKDDEEVRIRRRSQGNSSTYYKTKKIRTSHIARMETENFISPTDYHYLGKMRDAAMLIVRKSRFCFVYNSQYFELDVFAEPVTNLIVLEIELTEENDKVDLPPFLKIKREVTNDLEFSNSSIARTGKVPVG